MGSVMSRTSLFAATTAAALAVAAPGTAIAQSHHASGSHHIKKGKTTLTANLASYAGLSSDGFTIATVGRAKQSGQEVTFPITGGTVNPKKLTGHVKSAGGLSITKDGVTIVVKNARSNLHTHKATAFVTGKGKGFTALKLGKPSSVSSDSKSATFTGYEVSLSKKLIAYLDKKFKTTDFKTYSDLGSATTRVVYKKS